MIAITPSGFLYRMEIRFYYPAMPSAFAHDISDYLESLEFTFGLLLTFSF